MVVVRGAGVGREGISVPVLSDYSPAFRSLSTRSIIIIITIINSFCRVHFQWLAGRHWHVRLTHEKGKGERGGGEESLQEPHAFLAPKTDRITDICKVPTLQLKALNKHNT